MAMDVAPLGRWRGVSDPVFAVGGQVELFEHDLSAQDLAPGRSHDGLDPRGEVPDFDRYVRHRSFFPCARVGLAG